MADFRLSLSVIMKTINDDWWKLFHLLRLFHQQIRRNRQKINWHFFATSYSILTLRAFTFVSFYSHHFHFKFRNKKDYSNSTFKSSQLSFALFQCILRKPSIMNLTLGFDLRSWKSIGFFAFTIATNLNADINQRAFEISCPQTDRQT